MKKLLLLILLICQAYCYGQIISPNGDNLFYYNGNADVTFRFMPRGSGGRAMVHADGNVLGLNFGNDFTGGITLGNNYYVGTDGSFRSNAWQPWGSTSNDFYVDVEPGTRILRTRNWNITSPNIAVTGIHTGSGYFESSIGIGTTTPEAPLTVNGQARFYPSRIGAGDARQLIIGSSFSGPSFVSNDYPLIITTGGGDQPLILDMARVGIGTATPKEKLSVNGKIRAHEVKVETANWPDYVFEEGYRPKTLSEIENFIKENKHLPEVPSAKEVVQNGIELGEMNKTLLKKIEEMTLYMIELKKENLEVKQELLKIQIAIKSISLDKK